MNDNNNRLEEIRRQKDAVLKELENSADLYTKMGKVASRGDTIIDNIDERFEKATKLDRNDMKFLFLAVALQCTRILLQPNLELDFEKIARENRHDASKDGNKEKKQRKQQAKKNEKNNIESKKENNPDTVRIFLYPVPYDAVKGTKRIVIPGVSPFGKELYGGNHHSATIGHDPIAGLVVGPVNILTRTITFRNPILQTSEVRLEERAYEDPKKYSGQYVTEKDISKVELVLRLKDTIKEDSKRVPAALGRHLLHLQSDKYCKDGLPIPFVSPQQAQQLIDADWNSQELWRLTKFVANDALVIGAQALISILINVLIETIHKFSYKEEMGISRDLYSVKTHKILEISNVIASMSNVIAVALGSVVGFSTGNIELTKKSIENLDIGGLLVTIYRIAADQKFIQEVKMEYLKNEWYDYVIKEMEV